MSGLESWDAKVAKQARSLLAEYHDLFSLEKNEIGRTKAAEHVIELKDPDATLFKERFRRIPPPQVNEVREHLKLMLDAGAIRPSNSPWCNAMVLVRKKDGSLRFCIDFRRLNSLTKKDSHPLPRICETFQRLMQNCLGELNLMYCLIYLDDVIVYSKTPEEHLQRMCVIFDHLREHGLKLKPTKCDLFRMELIYLAHHVGKDGVKPSKKNVTSIVACSPPKTYTDIQSFTGVVGHYRGFIKGFAHIAAPLYDFISGDNKDNKEASWLHAELLFVLVSRWLPQQHMVSIWTPHGIHVETLWCPVETT